MAKDRIRFEVRWATQHSATLLYVIDNGVSVLDPGVGKPGRGKVGWTYEADSARTHTIEWSVWFGEKELSTLEAVATIDDGDEQLLNSTDEDTNRWHDTGVARRAK